ncbi:MAG: thioredoxin domain-containing protein [Gammaproteobacteria bacterium]|nr:thioredoxin domain-containing protein [Gammaproteobacteria bacterium]
MIRKTGFIHFERPMNACGKQRQALCALLLCWVTAATGDSLSVLWQPWREDSFRRAQRENKLIFMDVGTEWCGACQKQESITYADREVIALLNDRFISIKVDAEVQPDVGELYSAWGWPALIFLLPDGTQINEFAGFRRPDRFLPILRTVLDRQRQGTLMEWRTDLKEGADPAPEALQQLSQRINRQLDRSFNENNGGWGGPARSPLPIHVEQAFFRAHVDGVPFWRERALDTLEGTARLLDPVWGGVFAAGKDDWSLLAPEKIGWKQAGVIQNFAEAYQVTGKPRWLDLAVRTRGYLDRFLKSPDGTYFNSQDPFRHAGSAEADHGYFQLDDAGRRALGIPDVDRTVQTDNNARLIIAFAHAFAAGGDAAWLDSAQAVARRMISGRNTGAGWYRQLVPGPEIGRDARVRDLPEAADLEPVIYLRTQVWMGHALLALYGTTGNKEWLALAQELYHAMAAHLLDAGSGGFVARRPPGAGPVLVPVSDNALAALFLQRLAYYRKPGGDEPLLAQAESALKAVGGADKVEREGKMVAELALAVQHLLAGPFEFSVVGTAGDPMARELFLAAVRAYEPRKILKYEAPGRYPDLGRPALYICTSTLCTKPITAATEVDRALAEFQLLVAQTTPSPAASRRPLPRGESVNRSLPLPNAGEGDVTR